MENALFLAFLLSCTVFAIFIVNRFVNPKIKLYIDYLIVFLAFSASYYFYTINSPIKKVYNTAYNYFLCYKKQLLENECNELLSKLEASKVKAEIADENPTIINKTITLASYEANPELEDSPYNKIKTSLMKYPLFIKPNEDNFLMYDDSFCKYFKDPFYQIVGWLVEPTKYTVYIAAFKQNDCPKKYEINEFPFITSEQFETLKEGYYWQKRPADILPYFTQKIVLVDSLQFSFNDLKKISQADDKNKISDASNIQKSTNTQTNLQSKNIDISDIQNLGTYGKDNIELYKSNKSCFISISGKNSNNDQAVILWNPKYPEWLIIYPGISTTLDAIKFSRNNQSELSKEIITDYVVLLDNISYQTKGVYLNNKIVKIANFPISDLKAKLINADNVIIHLQNSINASQTENDYYFGLNGFEKATQAYESLCINRF